MSKFSYYNAAGVKDALAVLADNTRKAYALSAGTDLLGEIKNDIISPDVVVNLKSIAELSGIEYTPGKGITIGATTTLTEIAENEEVRKRYPGLAEAALSVGSPQIRNVGTLGGNLCQRPRCWYYRGDEYPCIRKGGSTCFAVDGRNKYHAIIGGGPCFIVHPSDVAPMLMALKAEVEITSTSGSRRVSLDDFFILPETDSMKENILVPGEIITKVIVPEVLGASTSCYLKFKERESRDFALVGAAVALEMDGDACKDISLVLSGVCPAPYRAEAAEKQLKGSQITLDLVENASKAALADAMPLSENEYKVQLAGTILKRAVLRAAGVKI